MRAKCNPVTGLTIPLVALALFVALGCSRTTGAAKPADSPEVEVAMVEQRDVPIYGEWIGTLDGMVNADIKAQVTGYLIKQDYTEGSFVKKGQLLFEIDARPFEAALNQAKGQGAAVAIRSAARCGASKSGPNPARREPLRPTRQAAGHHPGRSR
jgi:multidrug efflux pump subunit AcrA (membrane-fusion protein)